MLNKWLMMCVNEHRKHHKQLNLLKCVEINKWQERK